MSNVPTIQLNDGNEIPQLGFGVWQVAPEETAAAVGRALEVGYRHVDTAEMYGNERGVGEAVRASGLDRSDVYITSKLNNGFHAPDDARRAIDQTLTDLGTDHVDLFLIHWPLPTIDVDYVDTWKALEEFKADGRARSIGVSNFQVAHLQRLLDEADVVPAVNQIELHPYLLNDEVRAFGEEHGVVTEAWSPLASGQLIGDPVVEQLADEVGRTQGQVLLRWHVQRGFVVFPKSVTPSRIEENFRIFDFELSDDAMRRLTELDRGEEGRTGPHPDRFAFVPS